jgi:hypothetical protein
MPTNRHLMDMAPEAATAETRRMIGQWGFSMPAAVLSGSSQLSYFCGMSDEAGTSTVVSSSRRTT